MTVFCSAVIEMVELSMKMVEAVVTVDVLLE